MTSWLLVTAVAPSLKVVEDSDEPRRVEVIFSAEQDAALQRRLDHSDPQRVLHLMLLDESGKPGPPIFARVQRHPSGRLVLTPRYALTAGRDYLATAEVEGGRWKVRHRVPEQTAPTPHLTDVFPATKALPANCLKFYLYFSQPMREGREIFDLIRLEDEQGQIVLDPWRRTELWSADARRLTLWIHPGRIKRGVNLRVELGPVLQPDRAYRLVLDSRIRSAAGAPLGKEVVRHFHTTAEDHTRPLPSGWRLTLPMAGTKFPLRVTFREPLDVAQLSRFLHVEQTGGQTIEGVGLSTPDQSGWQFTPSQPWRSGPCQLRVDGRLEDLAGNTPLRVFDRDLTVAPPVAPKLIRRFLVK